MPLRDRSGQRWQRSGRPYVVAATKAWSRFIGTCRDPYPSPLPSLPFGLFPNATLRCTPLSLVCPWALVRSWEHLPSSFSLLQFPSWSLSLSLFLSSSLSFLSPSFLLGSLGVSLDACVVAGNTVVFSFFSPFSPHPSLPRAQCTYTQTRSLQQVLNEVWLSSVCVSFMWFPVFHRVSRSHTFFSSFLSCPPVFTSGHLSLSFVCMHMGSGLSVYVRNLLQLRFQVAQVFTMRWCFIGCPCALGFPFIATTHTHTHLCPSCSLFMSSLVCLTAHTRTQSPRP